MNNITSFDYLKEKGFTENILHQFKISVLENAYFYSYSFPEEGKSLIKKEYDNGIIIPFFSIYESLLGLVVRKMFGNSKFLTSFPKKYYLFGLNLAWRNIIEKGYSIIVEGPFDMMRLYQDNFPCIAICGSYLSTYQACLLKRFCNNVFILCDSDRSGKESTFEIAQQLEEMNFKIKKVFLPDSYDPDTFLQKFGKKELEKLINF